VKNSRPILNKGRPVFFCPEGASPEDIAVPLLNTLTLQLSADGPVYFKFSYTSD
jgi:hypothetical protein